MAQAADNPAAAHGAGQSSASGKDGGTFKLLQMLRHELGHFPMRVVPDPRQIHPFSRRQAPGKGDLVAFGKQRIILPTDHQTSRPYPPRRITVSPESRPP